MNTGSEKKKLEVQDDRNDEDNLIDWIALFGIMMIIIVLITVAP